MKIKEWLRPGIKVKRFILPGILGIISISYGAAIFLSSLHYWSITQYVLSSFMLFAGVVLLIFSVRYTTKSIVSILPKNGTFQMKLDNDEVTKLMYEKRILVKGPKIVVIGGGTGLSNLLRGIKRYSSNLTAIVTVADDGGGSGVLRQEMGILPPGDIRNCILALANTEPLMHDLLQYRFNEGSLKGQNFGNLFLAALSGISNNFEEAVRKMSSVLAIVGRVLPVSGSAMRINAELVDGKIIEGESNIGEHPRENKSRIKRVFMKDDDVQALPEVLTAIKEADVIVFAPGSVYTSIVPVLIVPEVSETIMKSSAIRIYACNIMTQPNETEGYSVSDHIYAIEDHSFKNIIQFCLVNAASVPNEIKDKYMIYNSEPVIIDKERIPDSVNVIEGDYVSFSNELVRHDTEKLTMSIIELVVDKKLVSDKKRAIDYYYVKERMKG